jgi:hypothetical protein
MEKTRMPKYVSIYGKVSDMCIITLLDEKRFLIEEHVGYVPPFPAIGGSGDYIEIEVENETGKIVDWKPIEKLTEDE